MMEEEVARQQREPLRRWLDQELARWVPDDKPPVGERIFSALFQLLGDHPGACSNDSPDHLASLCTTAVLGVLVEAGILGSTT